jgi:predicted type IV restriction endonuclease
LDGGILAFSESALTGQLDARLAQQIGWSSAGTGIHWSLIDPGKMVTQDLWVENIDGTNEMNYLITLLPIELSPAEGVLALIKENQQDALD